MSTPAQETINKMVGVLAKVPIGDRTRFARAQLTTQYPRLIAAFDGITAGRAKRSVLFISLRPHHAREPKLAAAARTAGWDVYLAHTGKAQADAAGAYTAVERVEEISTILVGWAFPGQIVHVFAEHGAQAFPLCHFKHRRVVIDLFDTCSGQRFQPPDHAHGERAAMALADGMVHRDLRGHLLRRLHGYKLPPSNLFLLDPLADAAAPQPRERTGDAVRVVAVGWAGDEDTSIMQTCQFLCMGGIHVHVYPFPAISKTGAYQRLRQLFPDHFHLHEPVFGPEYHDHLRHYDFGLLPCEQYIFGEQSSRYTDDYLAGCGSSRLMDYIQAGLGIIISPDRKFQYACARRYATCTVLSSLELLQRPQAVLKAAQERKVAVPSSKLESITIEAASARLSSFYQQVCKSAAVRPVEQVAS